MLSAADLDHCLGAFWDLVELCLVFVLFDV